MVKECTGDSTESANFPCGQKRAGRDHLLQKRPSKDLYCHTKDFGIYSVNKG